MGEAGLKQKTRYGNATLMIAANLPDIDVLVFFTNTPSVEFRRGWTHGLLAQLVLPVALTAIVAAVDRFRGRARPDTGAGVDAAPDQPPLSIPWLLALSFAGVYSHVALDFLNNYDTCLPSRSTGFRRRTRARVGFSFGRDTTSDEIGLNVPRGFFLANAWGLWS